MIYTFGDFRIDATRFEISRGGRALAAEPQVLELLIALIEGRDHVVGRDELLERVWKGRIVSDTTLSSRIKTARQILGDDGTRQEYIKTIHGRGFRFVGDVAVETDARTEHVQEPTATDAAAADRPATRYARSGDIHVAYQLFGAGPVNLVLCPGFVSHIDNFWDNPALNRWLTQLGGLARMAIFDKRGTGLSDRVTALPGMDERMDDVRAVMDAVGFETAFIMGISEGGSLAALFTAHHPARADGLILYGAFAQFKYWFPDEASLQALFDYIESDWGSGKSLPQFAPSVGDDPEAIRWWGKFERLGATPGAAITLMRMNSQIDISAVLPSIRVPTLVLHPANDVVIDVEAGQKLAEHIPGAQYVELPGRDHLPWLGEKTAMIVEAIRRFVAQPAQRKPSDRVLATILLVRSGKRADGKMADAERAIVEEALRRFRPNRIAEQPRGLAATFDGPARALECAVSVADALRRDGADHRVGVHTGEISFEGERLVGTAMDISADVVDHASAGEILVSRTVHDLVAGSGVALEDRGEFPLPSIRQTWHLFQVAA